MCIARSGTISELSWRWKAMQYLSLDLHCIDINWYEFYGFADQQL